MQLTVGVETSGVTGVSSALAWDSLFLVVAEDGGREPGVLVALPLLDGVSLASENYSNNYYTVFPSILYIYMLYYPY